MAVLAIGAIGAMLAPAGYASLAFSIASGVANMLLRPKPPDQHIEGPRAGDLRMPRTSYGQGIAILEGTTRVACTPLWLSKRRDIPHTTSQEVGGKMGGGGQTVTSTTWSHEIDVWLLLGEGEGFGDTGIEGVDQLYANGELIYDVTPSASGDAIGESSRIAKRIQLYPGTLTQDIDPTIEAVEGVGDTAAYIGLAGIMLESFNLDRWQGQLPHIEARVVKTGTTAANAQSTIGDVGANNIPQILGAGGAVCGQPDSSLPNCGVKWNVYAGAARVAVYAPVSFGYNFTGVNGAGEPVSVNSGGYLVIARNDGTADVYTGAGGGQNSLAFEGELVVWGQGSGVGTHQLYRMVLNPTTKAITNTLISGSRSERLFKNALGIPGRLYTVASGGSSGATEVGYVDTNSYVKVPLIVGTNYANRGLLSRDGYMWLSTTTAAQKWSTDGVLIDSLTYPSAAQRELFEDRSGLIWAIGAGTDVYVINPATLDVMTTLSPVSHSSVLGFTEDNRLITYSGGVTHLLQEVEKLGRITPGTTTTGAYLTKLAGRVGLTPDRLDVTAMTDTLHGIMFTDRPECGAVVDEICRAYGADVVESAGKIKFVKRGGSSLITIQEDDIGAFAENETPPIAGLVINDKNDPELPGEITLIFPDRNAALQDNSVYARRLIGHSRNRRVIRTPIAFSPDEAQRSVQRMMDDAWAGRRHYTLAVTRKHVKYEPGDIVTPIFRGRAHPMQLVETVQDGSLVKWQGQSHESVIAIQTGVGGQHSSVKSMTIRSAPTQLVMLDIPQLRDIDDDWGPYAGMAGYADGWPGGELFRSTDDGASYQQAGVMSDTPCVIGSAISVLGNFLGGNVFDEQNSVTVTVGPGMSLVSYTRDQVYNGFGAFALNSGTGIEVLQYRDATLVAPRTYKLTGLLRGRKGTEQFMSTHALGDRFVLLQSATLRRFAGSGADLNTSRKYKAVGFGRTLDETAEMTFTNTGVSLKPLSPVLLGGGRDAAGTLFGKFMRRTSASAEWPDYVEAPLGNALAAYEVDIFNSTFTTLKRTITSTPSANGSVVNAAACTFTYDDADQVADWGSLQNPIYVSVQQLSAVIGRGYALRGQL